MQRVLFRNLRHVGVPIAILVLGSSVTVFGQSLGDVARETRGKKAAATAPPKVITNGDLAKDEPGTDATSAPSKAETASSGKPGIRNAAASSTTDPHAAEQWRRQILAQKITVETLEKRFARFQASLSSVDASAIARGEILSRNQALERDRLAQVREQLDEQRAKLLEMQEEARRAGMHTQVYDP